MLYLVIVIPQLHFDSSEMCGLLVSSNKPMSPYSLMYLLFRSVILIFIATFCECTVLLDSLGRDLSESMVIFLDKSLQTDNQKHLSSLTSLLTRCVCFLSYLAFLLVET